MSRQIILERQFLASDQHLFAALSGDRNPMHMDALVARRTMAGFPVVHGIHALLWGLDGLFRRLPAPGPIASLRATFEKMIYVGDQVRLELVKQDANRSRLVLVANGNIATTFEIVLGEPNPVTSAAIAGPVLRPETPLVLSFEQMITGAGRIPFADSAADISQHFPAAAAVLGVRRIAWLACSSFLVGMVCPGLHSIYRSLKLTTVPQNDEDQEALTFRVTYHNPQFRLLRMSAAGGGWHGTIEAHARPEPARQAGMREVMAKVAPAEFAGAAALVVGGSRGLGELTAKILAAGGARVMLTYLVGEADARRVQSEITAQGGRCDILRHDVRTPARGLVEQLPVHPDQFYYLATPPIFQRQNAIFVDRRLDEFLAFYVTGFYHLYRELRAASDASLAAFYPSSVFVEERPAQMTEYAMAKAAAEILCADIGQFENNSRIVARRLPRLPTDQTAALSDVQMDDPLEVMLPIIRDVHAAAVMPQA